MEAELSHPLLLAQLRDHFGTDIPPNLDQFLLCVDRAYHESDAERDRLQRSVSLALQRLLALSGGAPARELPDLAEEIRRATELLVQNLAAGPRARPSGPAPFTSSRSATILCVVEGGLLRLIERVLSARGHEILEATSGEAARELMSARAGRLDLLVLDDNLPDVEWAPLYSDLRARLAGPVVLLSNDTTWWPEPGGPIALRKPFSIEELVEAVAEGLVQAWQ